jgi:hypothetical protein
MNKLLLRQKATALRKLGKTYSEIQKELKTKIAKNKLSYWCKGVVMPPWYKKKIIKINIANFSKARSLGQKALSEKRQTYLENLAKNNLVDISRLDKYTQKLLLSILYLGEGAKHSRSSTLTLGSSNPMIIKLYLKLLKNCYSIEKSKFRVRIQCRFDQNINDLEDYWEKITEIDKKQFYPTYIDQRTKGKPTLKKGYKGVCTIHYFNKEIQLGLGFLANEVIKKLVQ